MYFKTLQAFIKFSFTLETSLIPPADVNTSLFASSNALSIRLKPLWHCKEPTLLLTSASFRRFPVNVLNLRTTLASVLNSISAMRPPDEETLKKLIKVWTKYSNRFQLLTSQRDESIMNVVSIGIGHSSSAEEKNRALNYKLYHILLVAVISLLSL